MKLNLNNPILTALNKAFDALLATVYFVICCLPVITAGAAMTAVSAVMLRICRNECGGVTKTFFNAFRQNFRQATQLWLMALAVGGVLALEIWGCWFGTMEASAMREACRGITAFFGVLYGGILVYLFPQVGTFHVTVKQALQNCLIFVTRNVAATLILLLLAASAVVSVVLMTVFALPVLAVLLYLQALVIGRVFAPYLPKPEKGSADEEMVC